jgi:hypothetical protein
MPPDGGARADLHDALALAIPARHGHAPPRRLPVGQHCREVRQARPLGPWAPNRAGPARRRWRVEGGVEAQAGDAGHPPPDQGGQEVEGGEAAAGHEDQGSIGQPAPGLQDQLPGPVGQRLVPPAAVAAVALRRGERGQERQRPDPSGPRYGDQQHQAEPAQAAGLDEVTAAGADRVAVDALGADAPAAPALDGVVQAEEQRAARRTAIEQQSKQRPGSGPSAPGGAVEHAVVVDEAPLAGEPGDAKDAGDRALAGRQGSEHCSERRRLAPISSTSACRQLRWKKSGAKHRITAAKRDGGRGMAASLGGDPSP